MFDDRRTHRVEALIRELMQAYTQAGLDCGTGLLPPAPEADIDRAAEDLGQPVHDDLRAVWRVHGGQEYFGAGVSGLFGRHRLLTPAEAVEEYRVIWDCELEAPSLLAAPVLYNRPVLELVPFASWDAYDLCVHAVSGEVWEFLPSPGLLRHRPGIKAVLCEVLAAVRSGATEPELGW
jgi:hypothetical protein